MNVYLYELDIDEYGSEVSLPCRLDEYILKFTFFFDTIYLQGSSCLKRSDLFLFFNHHPDLFISDGNKHPLISFVLDSHHESLNGYIENRMKLLSNKRNNIEKSIYIERSAIKKSKELDHKIKRIDIKDRDHDVNVFFKQYLIELSNKMITFPEKDFNIGASIVRSYVLDNNFIQTFELNKEIGRNLLDNKSKYCIGRCIRECYFKANASAVNCDFHCNNWKLQYENINRYIQLIGLERVFKYNWKIDRHIIDKIKSLISFQSLLAIYFNFNNSERFIAFCDYIELKRKDSIYFLYEEPYFSKQLKLFNHDMNIIKRRFVSYHDERG